MIDFSQINGDTLKLADIQAKYTRQDLIEATNHMIDTMLNLVKNIPDSYVTFQPVDPDAYDGGAETEEEKHMAWTLAHVICHTTASGEETAAQGSTMARGIEPTWRTRYEVPWRTLTTTEQLVQRLEESRRIRLAFLNSWPNEPHLHILWRKKEKTWGLVNAVGYTLEGLKHDTSHLGQIAEIIRQAKEAEHELVSV